MTSGAIAPRPEQTISLLEMEVIDKRLRWALYRCTGDDHERIAGNTVELLLSARRQKTITMLSDLLRHAEDGSRRDALSPDLYDDLLRVVGHELFDLLFWGGDIRSSVADQLAQLRDRHVQLFRITLTFKGDTEAFFARLPWEYACTPVGDADLPEEGVFLAQRAELVLSRHLNIRRSRRLEYASWPIPVLLVVSSPEQDPADDKRCKLMAVNPTQIVHKLIGLEEQGFIQLHRLIEEPPEHPDPNYAWRVTRGAVAEMVEQRDPVIVHFLGHGRNFEGAGHLAFARDDGTVDWVPDHEFARLVEKSPRFNLAFLQACESALPDPYVSFSGVARHLAGKGLPAVVAMQYGVRSSTANLFAGAFYDALLTERLAIDHAVEKGRARILGDADENIRLSFGLPVVYLSSDRGLTDPSAMPPNQHRNPALEGKGSGDAIPCPRCGQEMTSSQKVCRWCGLRVRCGKCESRFEDPDRDRFCADCGQRLDQTPYDDDTIKRAPGVVVGAATKPARATLTALQGEDSG